jgi:HK97 family phage major capsid protein
MLKVHPQSILELNVDVPRGWTPGESLCDRLAFQLMVKKPVISLKAFSADFDFPFNVKAVLTEAGQGLTGITNPGVFGLPSQPPFVFQLLRQIPIDTAYVSNWQEGGTYETVADVGAEDSLVPGPTSWTMSDENLRVRTIYSLARASEELLSDLPMFSGFVDQRLIQSALQRLDSEIINGNGSGNHLKGILASSPTVLAKGALSRSDALLTALSRVRSIGFGSPSGIVMNHADALALATDKASTSGNYSAGAPGQYTDRARPIYEFGGAPVMQTSAIASGNVLVGDWSGAILFMRRNVRVETSFTDADNWQKGVITLKGSLRAVLLCHTPTKFVSITGF